MAKRDKLENINENLLCFLYLIILLYLIFVVWYVTVSVSDKFGDSILSELSTNIRLIKILQELRVCLFTLFSAPYSHSRFLDCWLTRSSTAFTQCKTENPGLEQLYNHLLLQSIQQQQDTCLLLCM